MLCFRQATKSQSTRPTCHLLSGCSICSEYTVLHICCGAIPRLLGQDEKRLPTIQRRQWQSIDESLIIRDPKLSSRMVWGSYGMLRLILKRSPIGCLYFAWHLLDVTPYSHCPHHINDLARNQVQIHSYLGGLITCRQLMHRHPA